MYYDSKYQEVITPGIPGFYIACKSTSGDSYAVKVDKKPSCREEATLRIAEIAYKGANCILSDTIVTHWGEVK